MIRTTSHFTPRTLFTVLVLALALVVFSSACSQSCQSYDNQGRCGTSIGEGKMDYR